MVNVLSVGKSSGSHHRETYLTTGETDEDDDVNKTSITQCFLPAKHSTK